jgi:hypothetical protein
VDRVSSRESLHAEAVRLLAEGRLCVLLADAERIEARVRGAEAEYSVGYERGGWRCSCDEARSGRRCPCVVALQLVTVRPKRERAAEAATYDNRRTA